MTSRIANRESLSTLIHKLDKLVSQVVRRSAAVNGYCTCISCGVKLWWVQADCAHFIDRGNMATRFNLLNLAPSCPICNRFEEEMHKEKWAEKLGPQLVETLELEGRSMRKLMRYELERGIELMTDKLKQLR